MATHLRFAFAALPANSPSQPNAFATIVPLVSASPPAQSPSPSHNRHASPPPPPNSHPEAAQKSDTHSTAARCGKSSRLRRQHRRQILNHRWPAYRRCQPSILPTIAINIRTSLHPQVRQHPIPVIIPLHHQQRLIVRIRQLNQLARQLPRRKMPMQLRALHPAAPLDHLRARVIAFRPAPRRIDSDDILFPTPATEARSANADCPLPEPDRHSFAARARSASKSNTHSPEARKHETGSSAYSCAAKPRSSRPLRSPPLNLRLAQPRRCIRFSSSCDGDTATPFSTTDNHPHTTREKSAARIPSPLPAATPHRKCRPHHSA